MALWRVRATVLDRPGFLAVLTASLALQSVNILSVGVHITEDGAVDDFLVDAPDELTERELLAAVARGRGQHAWAARTEARSLVDAPTRALDLATFLVRESGTPGTVRHALEELLDGRARWHATADQFGVAGTQMWVPASGGGAWSVERSAPPFTPAEYARAQALLAVAAQRLRPDRHPPAALLLRDGREVTLRRAVPEDLPAVRDMHGRCSPASLHRRYQRGAGGPADGQLTRLLDPRRGATLLAFVAGTGRVVAMANLAGEGVQAELALLVEDAWQGYGIGTALLRRGLALATDSGFDALVVPAHAGNTAMRRALARWEAPQHTERDGKLITVTVPLARAGAAV